MDDSRDKPDEPDRKKARGQEPEHEHEPVQLSIEECFDLMYDLLERLDKQGVSRSAAVSRICEQNPGLLDEVITEKYIGPNTCCICGWVAIDYDAEREILSFVRFTICGHNICTSCLDAMSYDVFLAYHEDLLRLARGERTDEPSIYEKRRKPCPLCRRQFSMSMWRDTDGQLCSDSHETYCTYTRVEGAVAKLISSHPASRKFFEDINEYQKEVFAAVRAEVLELTEVAEAVAAVSALDDADDGAEDV